jgi:hypothetical protein
MKTSTKALIAAAALLMLTVFHHVYGAVLYETPWRNHVALIVVPVLLAMIAAHEIHRRNPDTPLGAGSLWAFLALATVPIVVLGIFEGGYNHLVKDLLFFAGLRADLLDRLFPDSLYEMPDDLIFEVSGVLQLVVAASAARRLVRLWRERKESEEIEEPRVENVA